LSLLFKIIRTLGKVTAINYTPDQLEQYDSKELSSHSAIQYADYALGKFIRLAKSRAYWKNTVFLIVADHDARTSGRDFVPVASFHIPVVILNSERENDVDRRVVSQIDLPPTLLSSIGILNISPMLGHDLNATKGPGRAIMQYSDNFAYMKDENVAILQPQKEPLNFNYDFKSKKFSSKRPDHVLYKIVLAHALWGSLVYENEWYQSKKE